MRPAVCLRLRLHPHSCQHQHVLRALPVDTDTLASTSRIMPHYFKLYTDTICEYEQKHHINKRECLENMVLPSIEKQQEIAREFDMLIKTYPIDDAPSLRYTIFQLILQGEDEALTRIMELLNNYAISIAMLSEMVHNLNMLP